jgi:hypothetical protein
MGLLKDEQSCCVCIVIDELFRAVTLVCGKLTAGGSLWMIDPCTKA